MGRGVSRVLAAVLPHKNQAGARSAVSAGRTEEKAKTSPRQSAGKAAIMHRRYFRARNQTHATTTTAPPVARWRRTPAKAQPRKAPASWEYASVCNGQSRGPAPLRVRLRKAG